MTARWIMLLLSCQSAKSGGSISPPSRLSASLNICRAACRARCLTRTDSGSCVSSWRRAPGRGASQRNGSGVVAGMWVPVVIDQRVSRCWNPIRADHHLPAPSATHCVNCTNLGSLQDRLGWAICRRLHPRPVHGGQPASCQPARPQLTPLGNRPRRPLGALYHASLDLRRKVSVDHTRCGSPANSFGVSGPSVFQTPASPCSRRGRHHLPATRMVEGWFEWLIMCEDCGPGPAATRKRSPSTWATSILGISTSWCRTILLKPHRLHSNRYPQPDRAPRRCR